MNSTRIEREPKSKPLTLHLDAGWLSSAARRVKLIISVKAVDLIEPWDVWPVKTGSCGSRAKPDRQAQENCLLERPLKTAFRRAATLSASHERAH